MAFELKGTIKQMFETKNVSERFSKREFVLTTDEGKYAQTLLVQATGDRIAQLNGLGVGDQVSIAFNLRGREWTSPSGEVKYFTSVEAWKVERIGEARSQSAPASNDGGELPF